MMGPIRAARLIFTRAGQDVPCGTLLIAYSIVWGVTAAYSVIITALFALSVWVCWQ